MHTWVMDRVEILSARELETMRRSCRMAASCLSAVGEILHVGITTEDINRFVHEYITSRDAYPAPLNYNGFPKSVCTSVNEVVCHGIPGPQVLTSGDIINVDVTTMLPKVAGYFGDTSAMFYIGDPSEDAQKVVEVARESLRRAIAVVGPGARLGDIGHVIQSYAEAQGCSVVRDYVGHGVGRKFHMPPQVAHYGTAGTGRRLKEGMTFTIEPMINLGGFETELQSDGWTVLTRDRSLSAQFEHTLRVTSSGCEVLTAREGVLKHSEDRPWVRAA